MYFYLYRHQKTVYIYILRTVARSVTKDAICVDVRTSLSVNPDYNEELHMGLMHNRLCLSDNRDPPKCSHFDEVRYVH